MKLRARVTSETSRKLEDLGGLESDDLGSLGSSKIGKVREMNPPNVLYRG